MKGLAAVAHVGFLIGVGLAVRYEGGHTVECFPASDARVGPRVRMDGTVLTQRRHLQQKNSNQFPRFENHSNESIPNFFLRGLMRTVSWSNIFPVRARRSRCSNLKTKLKTLFVKYHSYTHRALGNIINS